MTDLVDAVRDLLGRCCRQSAVKTATAIGLMVLSGAVLPFAGLAMRLLVDAAVAGQRPAAVAAGVAVAAALMGALTLSHFAHISYFELAEMNLVEFDLELIALANGSPGLTVHEDARQADRLSLLAEEVQQIRLALEALLVTGGLIAGMALTAVLLALVDPLLLLLPLVAIPALLAGRRAEQVMDAARTAAAEPTRLARNTFRSAVSASSAKELRVYRLENDIRDQHTRLWTTATAVLGRAYLLSTGLRALGQLGFVVGYVGAVLLVVWEAATGRRSAGDVVLTIVLAAQVNVQVASAVSVLPALRRFAAVDRRMRELRTSDAVADAPSGGVAAPDRLTDGIRFEGVSLTYPGSGRRALCDVDLVLPAGATVAIVGENGAGKSSLVKLLCRFYQPTSGTITVDGADLTELALGGWRDRVAAGFQDFVRYEFLARETVGVGDLPRLDSDEAVIAALDRAGGSGIVPQLRDGLATQLGLSHVAGVDLSGGQWQKLALGRAFMRDTPLLLVLDEPTASLDAEAEHALFEQYMAQAARLAADHGTVTLLVSHRFYTVRTADLIVVVEDGRVVETGDHATLTANGGPYAQLYGLQAQAYR